MRTNYFFPAMLSMALLLGLSSCNKDDDKPQSSDTPDVENFERPNVVPLTFDRFEDQNVPEVTIGDADTSFLVINKSILQRFNLEVKDSSIIVVWNSFKHKPYAKQATKVEDAGDKLKVSVKYVDYSRALPDGDYVIGAGIYRNKNLSPRNPDGTINPDYYIDPTNNYIHPIAFARFNDDNGSNDPGYPGEYKTNFDDLPDAFMVEDLDGANGDVDLNFSFQVDINSINQRIFLTKDQKNYLDIGANNIYFKLLEGIAFKLNISTEPVWKKVGWFKIPWFRTTLDNFAMINYGEFDFGLKLGLQVTSSSVPGDRAFFNGNAFKPAPAALDAKPDPLDPVDLSDLFEPSEYDMNGFHVLDDKQKIVDELTDQKNEDNEEGQNTDLKRIVLKEFKGYGEWVMIGCVPVYLSMSPVLKLAIKKPLMNATASIGYNYSTGFKYHVGVGYSAKGNDVLKFNDGKDQITLDKGWHLYHNAERKDDGNSSIDAGLEGFVCEKVGLFFEVKGKVYECIGVEAGLGAYINATASGSVEGFHYDLKTGEHSAGDVQLATTGAFEIGATVGASLSAFGIETFAEGQLESIFYQRPLWKGMFNNKKGTVKKGKLSNDTDGDFDFAIALDDHTYTNFEWWPDDLELNTDFLLKDKINLQVSSITVDDEKISGVKFEGIPLKINNKRISNIISSAFTSEDGNYTCKIYDCVINYEDDVINFKYSVTVNGKEHIFNFEM